MASTTVDLLVLAVKMTADKDKFQKTESYGKDPGDGQPDQKAH